MVKLNIFRIPIVSLSTRCKATPDSPTNRSKQPKYNDTCCSSVCAKWENAMPSKIILYCIILCDSFWFDYQHNAVCGSELNWGVHLEELHNAWGWGQDLDRIPCYRLKEGLLFGLEPSPLTPSVCHAGYSTHSGGVGRGWWDQSGRVWSSPVQSLPQTPGLCVGSEGRPAPLALPSSRPPLVHQGQSWPWSWLLRRLLMATWWFSFITPLSSPLLLFPFPALTSRSANFWNMLA